MRIIGGKYRGTALASVGKGDTSAHLRPTTDRTRESLFNLLQHGPYPLIENARVLDLFAGTGALGFEALSRGAATATFVDDGQKSVSLIRENAAKLGIKPDILRQNATRLPQNPSDPYTLIFLDPPYGKALGEKALTACQTGNWLSPEATIIWEESSEQFAPAGFTKADARRYGDTWITILRRA
jgi:16S rRNA (guanine966-N2)-methyltransferase